MKLSSASVFVTALALLAACSTETHPGTKPAAPITQAKASPSPKPSASPKAASSAKASASPKPSASPKSSSSTKSTTSKKSAAAKPAATATPAPAATATPAPAGTDASATPAPAGKKHGKKGAAGGAKTVKLGGKMKERFDQMKTDLALTDDQAQKIETAMTAQLTASKAIRGDQSLADADKTEKLKETRKTYETELGTVLTPDQKKKWAELKKQHTPAKGAAATPQAPAAAAQPAAEQ